jgi:hypothetical protein
MTEHAAGTLSVRCAACEQAVTLLLGNFTKTDALRWAGVASLSEIPQEWVCPHCGVWNCKYWDCKIVGVANGPQADRDET